MLRIKTLIILLLLGLMTASCDGLKNKLKNMLDTSARAKYERQFSGADSLMTQWKQKYAAATASNLQISDGHTFTSENSPDELKALGYSLELQKGDRLIIETLTQNPETKIFVDVFETVTGPQPSETEILKNLMYSRVIDNTGSYKIIIQPEIEYKGRFSFSIYTQSSLAFPVAGKGNRDIQSFWGASRDNGGRRHEGVDIFAARGTPVIAATDGYITRTGNTGLGGKQVWQRDGILGNSLYYAHLDSIMVQGGTQVKTGDTLGLVGSTGNAEGGAPHLHFGIYSAGGATDPYPYLRQREVTKLKKSTILPDFKWAKSASKIRSGPGSQYAVTTTLTEKTGIEVRGVTGEWIHISTATGSEGFVSRERLE